MRLSEDQQVAVDTIQQWWRHGSVRKPFALGGYAGTGKTSIIPFIREVLGVKSAVVTYTNRASLVLRSKGIEDASTIHRLMYKLEDEGPPMRWSRKAQMDCSLVIVDESSMIGEKVDADLQGYGVPILYVGDPFQVPPVKDGDSVVSKPDYCLTKIHRQAHGSPIVTNADRIRRGLPLPYDGINVVDQYELTDEYLRSFDVVLCHTNGRRRLLNERIRTFEGPVVPGDKVCSLKNHYDHCVFNGEIGIVTRVRSKRVFEADFGFGPVWFHNAAFVGPDDHPYDEKFKGRQVFDFGYAVTVHKAQGSQFDSVLVWDERSMDARLKYTAITRAVKRGVFALR